MKNVEPIFILGIIKTITTFNMSIDTPILDIQILYDVCKIGDINLIISKLQSMDTRDKHPSYMEYGLYGACRGGHINIVEFLLSHGATDIKHGLRCASEEGYLNIILYLIGKGAGSLDFAIENLHRCYRDHIDVLTALVKMGADIDKYYTNIQSSSLIYMVHNGVTKFGKYSARVAEYTEWKEYMAGVIRIKVIGDISPIICSYI